MSKKTKIKCNRCGDWVIVGSTNFGEAQRYVGDEKELVMHEFPFRLSFDSNISLENQVFHLCSNCLQEIFAEFDNNPLEG